MEQIFAQRRESNAERIRILLDVIPSSVRPPGSNRKCLSVCLCFVKGRVCTQREREREGENPHTFTRVSCIYVYAQRCGLCAFHFSLQQTRIKWNMAPFIYWLLWATSPNCVYITRLNHLAASPSSFLNDWEMRNLHIIRHLIYVWRPSSSKIDSSWFAPIAFSAPQRQKNPNKNPPSYKFNSILLFLSLS
jgi:hypothetical protein